MLLPAAIILNRQTNTYHPVFFRPAPMPSGTDVDMGCLRYKSKCHHTEGFRSKELAKEFIEKRQEFVFHEIEYEWDGTGIPAIVTWFSLR